MKFLYLLVVTNSLHLMIATANSVTVEANTEAVDNNTCWTNIPCETSSTPQAGLLKEVIEDHDMDCYPWMFRNSTNGKCECSNIPYHSVLCHAEISRTSILDCYCMTYDSKNDETQLGICVYGCGHKTDTVFYTLPNHTFILLWKNEPGLNTVWAVSTRIFTTFVLVYEMKCMN